VALEALPSLRGEVRVTRYQAVSANGFVWSIVMPRLRGNQPLMAIDASELVSSDTSGGNVLDASVTERSPGQVPSMDSSAKLRQTVVVSNSTVLTDGRIEARIS